MIGDPRRPLPNKARLHEATLTGWSGHIDAAVLLLPWGLLGTPSPLLPMFIDMQPGHGRILASVRLGQLVIRSTVGSTYLLWATTIEMSGQVQILIADLVSAVFLFLASS